MKLFQHESINQSFQDFIIDEVDTKKLTSKTLTVCNYMHINGPFARSLATGMVK